MMRLIDKHHSEGQRGSASRHLDSKSGNCNPELNIKNTKIATRNYVYFIHNFYFLQNS